jgi:hypothetical protein
VEDVAVDEDDPLLLADLVSVPDVVLAVVELLASEAAALDEPASPAVLEAVFAPSDDDFFPWSRKSVTYQPLPLSAKPAAVTCLTIFG